MVLVSTEGISFNIRYYFQHTVLLVIDVQGHKFLQFATTNSCCCVQTVTGQIYEHTVHIL